jgi:hypothetical protein
MPAIVAAPSPTVVDPAPERPLIVTITSSKPLAWRRTQPLSSAKHPFKSFAGLSFSLNHFGLDSSFVLFPQSAILVTFTKKIYLRIFIKNGEFDFSPQIVFYLVVKFRE